MYFIHSQRLNRRFGLFAFPNYRVFAEKYLPKASTRWRAFAMRVDIIPLLLQIIPFDQFLWAFPSSLGSGFPLQVLPFAALRVRAFRFNP
jgi:hypothetical protein